SAVLVDRLQTARADANADEFLQLRNPDPMLVQVGHKQTRHIFGHVPADAAFFLGYTAAVNDAAARGVGTGNSANSRHGAGMRGAQDAARSRFVKRMLNRAPLDFVKVNSRNR